MLRDDLAVRLAGERACFVAVGNVDRGDDGFGVHLGEALRAAGLPSVLIAGTAPERHMGRLLSGGHSRVVFLDAVDFAGEPGSVVLLDAGQMRARFPQVSTHTISLGTLAALIERETAAKVFLLGVQPRTLEPAGLISPAVHETSGMLAALLTEVAAEPQERLTR